MSKLVHIAPFVLAVLAGCSGPPTDAPAAAEQSSCDRAVEQVAECEGKAPTATPTTCEGEAKAAADDLVAQFEANGCSGPPGGKDDSLFCRAGAWDPLGWCDETPDPLGPTPAGAATKYPIVLAHGFNTSTTNFWRFNDVDVALQADGHDVTLGSVPPFDTPAVRAGFLAEQVSEVLLSSGAEKVNLICFSAGGLDCRYLASDSGLGRGGQIASITTVSAPHRGTRVADVAVGLLPESESKRGKAFNFLATLYGKTFSEVADDSNFIGAMTALSEASADEFNKTILDSPGVFYQSWASFSNVAGLPNPIPGAEAKACSNDAGETLMLMHPGKRDSMDALLVGGAPFVAHGARFKPNDGVSTVESAKWGLFRGCVPADHLDMVGQINDEGADKRTGFDFIRFYRNMAFDLAARGY